MTDSLVKIDSLSETKLVIEGFEGPTGIVSDELDPPPPPQEMIIKRIRMVATVSYTHLTLPTT